MSEIHTRNGIQALELVDRYFDALFAGQKRNTQRYQEQRTEPGFLIFEASDDPVLLALVWVEDVIYTALRDVHDAVGGEKYSPDELLAGMRKHYPDIQLDSEIMVVKHLSPLETYRQHGIPDALQNVFTADYIAKVESYA